MAEEAAVRPSRAEQQKNSNYHFSSDAQVFESRLRATLGPRTSYVLTADICDRFTDIFRENGSLAAQQYFLERYQHYDLLLAMAKRHRAPTNKLGGAIDILRVVVSNLVSLKDLVLSDPTEFDEQACSFTLPFQRSHFLTGRHTSQLRWE